MRASAAPRSAANTAASLERMSAGSPDRPSSAESRAASLATLSATLEQREDHLLALEDAIEDAQAAHRLAVRAAFKAQRLKERADESRMLLVEYGDSRARYLREREKADKAANVARTAAAEAEADLSHAQTLADQCDCHSE